MESSLTKRTPRTRLRATKRPSPVRLAAGLLAGGLLAVFPSGTARAERPLNIVATTPELGALATALAGENARVRTVTSGREDPHFLQARPAFMIMARDADLWIRMGMDLEVGWEPILLDGARNAKVRPGQSGHFDAGSAIVYALETPDASASRAMGDVHPHGNPHYMTDPLNARAVARALAARLGEIDPQRAADYAARLTTFLARLDRAMFGDELIGKIQPERLWAAEKDNALPALLEKEKASDQLGGWRGAMRPMRDRPVIVFHKSWSYFAHRFGLRIVAELEPLPGVPPTPSHLAQVIALAKEQKVDRIVREPFYPARPANFVAAKVGAGMRAIEVNSYGTDASAEGYFVMMDAIVAAFTQ